MVIHATHTWDDVDAEPMPAFRGDTGLPVETRLPHISEEEASFCVERCPCRENWKACEEDARCPYTPAWKRHALENGGKAMHVALARDDRGRFIGKEEA